MWNWMISSCSTILPATRSSALRNIRLYDYYQMCYGPGWQLYQQHPNLDSISPVQRRAVFDQVYATGRQGYQGQRRQYGDIMTRPTDRRENYVKRCRSAGDDLADQEPYRLSNGKANKEPDNVQYTYYMKLKAALPTIWWKTRHQQRRLDKSPTRTVTCRLPNVPTTYSRTVRTWYRASASTQTRRITISIHWTGICTGHATTTDPSDSRQRKEYTSGYKQYSYIRTSYQSVWGATTLQVKDGKNLYQRQTDRQVHIQDGLLLDDGRQPPQSGRQPLLGFRAWRSYRR